MTAKPLMKLTYRHLPNQISLLIHSLLSLMDAVEHKTLRYILVIQYHADLA